MTPHKVNEEHTRVLHIGKYFAPHKGGMETFLRDLIAASQSQGIECSAIVHSTNIRIRASREIHSLDGNATIVVRAATWFRLLFTPISPSYILHLRKLIIEQRPRILHLHLPNPSALVLLFLPRARRITWIAHWQSDVITSQSSALLRLIYYFFRPFERALLKKTKHIIVSSPSYLDHSKALKPFRQKCQVIPLGVADSFSNNGDRESKRAPGPRRVLAVGRLTHYKGFDLLLKAIARTSNINLKLLGDGEQGRTLKRLATELKIQHRVEFCGSTSDIVRNEELQDCDCLCLPSTDRTESFGIALLEAMSAGKACVVSDVEGSCMSWVVEHNYNGLVFKNRSDSALASALQQLEKNRAHLDYLGTNGRTKYEATFTTDKTTNSILSLYQLR